MIIYFTNYYNDNLFKKIKIVYNSIRRIFMRELLANLDTIVNSLLTSLGIYGPILGSVLILVESMLPILPLSVFITLNFYAFGNLFGFFISYVLTVIGCNLAFYISRKLLYNKMDKIYKKYGKKKILKLMKKFSNIKFNHLVLFSIYTGILNKHIIWYK